jgi:hypothetical protein
VQSVKSYDGDDLAKISPDFLELEYDKDAISFKTPMR